METKRVVEIFSYLESLFGKEPKCELDYSTDIQLLVAIILSARCTDKRVNIVTKQLFSKYKTVLDYAVADATELEEIIYPCGFYKEKAKNIVSMAKTVCNNHNGVIPKDIEDLLTLSGVGRKTASVFLGEFYSIPAIAVDTHVQRVSKRLSLAKGKAPVDIEKELAKVFIKQNWIRYHKYLVLFGRYYCKSQNPLCETCKIKNHCSSSIFTRPLLAN